MRRTMCLLILAALLAMSAAPAALAITGQEALFGGDAPVAPGADDSTSDDSGSANQYPTLKLGDQDSADSTAYIVFMQNRLIELGYLTDAADGTYGENTQRAVASFQKNNGLPETGIADSATQEKLYSDITTLVAMVEDSSMIGGVLTRAQTMLGQWGFYGGPVDGQKGSGTDDAIRKFKAYMKRENPSFGVTPTPVPTATPDPNRAFNDMPLVVDQPLATPSVAYEYDETITDAVMEYVDGAKDFVVFRENVKEGDTGEEALRV